VSTRQPARRWAAFVAWTAAGAVFLFRQDYAGAVLPSGRPAGAGAAALLALPAAVVFALGAVLAFRFARREPLGQGTRPGRAALQLGAGLLVAGATVGVRFAARALLASHGPQLDPARDAGELQAALLLYLVLLALAHAVEYSRRLRAKQVAELRLQADLAGAELQRTGAELRMLKMQLNPHFLFNSLHAVHALVRPRPGSAERMLVGLSDLLRRAMHSVGTQEVALEEELEGLRPFVEVERLRLGEGLRVEWQVEEDALDALVPHMLLQPLVENAIKHGIVPAGGRGCITIAARRDGDRLRLEVRDDGAGLSPSASAEKRPGGGVGSENVRARLRQLYGEAHSVDLHPAEGGGTVASVDLPWHEEPVPLRPAARALAVEPRARAALLPYARRTAALARAAAVLAFAALWLVGFNGRAGVVLAPGHTVSTAAAIGCAGLNALLWTAIVAAAVRLTHRWLVGRRGWPGAMGVHAASALAAGAAVVLEKVACRVVMGYAPGELLPTRPPPLVQVVEIAFLYLILLGVAHALEYARRFRQKEVVELRLQADLAGAELQRAGAELRMLKMQLNPHFLFNSLHAVHALVRPRPGSAERMLVGLSDLLRRAMHSVGTQEVALEEELEGLRPFVEVERLRLGEGLRVEWQVEEDALDALVPHMLLQPLVENAIKHGIVPAGGRGCITVAARRDGDRLRLEVRDDGAGLSPSASAEKRPGGGVGSANVRARLRQLYGEAHSVDLHPAEGGGTVAVVHLPWHESPVGAAAPPPAASVPIPASR
jgi:two-component system LytT family sensor kinase